MFHNTATQDIVLMEQLWKMSFIGATLENICNFSHNWKLLLSKKADMY